MNTVLFCRNIHLQRSLTKAKKKKNQTYKISLDSALPVRNLEGKEKQWLVFHLFFFSFNKIELLLL